jgi:hypothetical protein
MYGERRDYPPLIREDPWFCCRTRHRSSASVRDTFVA